MLHTTMTNNEAKSSAEFDAYASNYDESLNRGLSMTGESKEYYANGRIQWMRQRLALHGCQSASCLDFGCGTGTSAVFLRDGLQVTHYAGYDPSSDSIAEARRHVLWPEASFTDNAEKLPAESFDLAFCNGVFHHIPPAERLAAIDIVLKSLKPGGIFAFWENNRWNPAVHWVMSKVPFDQGAQMLFPHQARRLLKTGGLNVLSTDYLFVFPALLKALRPLEPAVCKLPLGGQYLILAQKPAAD
jgi:SAM-dependent methyltransferase